MAYKHNQKKARNINEPIENRSYNTHTWSPNGQKYPPILPTCGTQLSISTLINRMSHISTRRKKWVARSLIRSD